MINQLPTCSAEHAPVAPETAPECACTHPKGDAITCIAEQHHMSRFNAMLVFGRGDIDRYPGQCTCPCHRDVAYRSVGEVLSESGKKKARAK